MLGPARDARGQWLRGYSGNTVKAYAYKEVTQLARDKSMSAMRKLIKLMSDPDSRVAYMATTHLLERAYGKPREYDPREEAPPTLDLLKLSGEERDQLRILLEKARSERAAVAALPANDGTKDG